MVPTRPALKPGSCYHSVTHRRFVAASAPPLRHKLREITPLTTAWRRFVCKRWNYQRALHR